MGGSSHQRSGGCLLTIDLWPCIHGALVATSTGCSLRVGQRGQSSDDCPGTYDGGTHFAGHQDAFPGRRAGVQSQFPREAFRTDAKCETGRVVVAGWECGGEISTARWFSFEVLANDAPWLYYRGVDVQKMSTAAEMLASYAALHAFGYFEKETNRRNLAEWLWWQLGQTTWQTSNSPGKE